MTHEAHHAPSGHEIAGGDTHPSILLLARTVQAEHGNVFRPNDWAGVDISSRGNRMLRLTWEDGTTYLYSMTRNGVVDYEAQFGNGTPATVIHAAVAAATDVHFYNEVTR